MSLPLIALALATFGIGSAEFVIQGLLPEVSTDLSVSIPTAGLLVTGYALGVAGGGPIMVVFVNRLRPKTALLSLLGLFVIGNVFSAVAPTYNFVLVARIIASFCHGAYFGIALVVAASIVPDNRRASAVSLVFGGLTIANILGVPAGTALGQAFGWRASFWAVSLVGAVAMAAITFWLPQTAGGERASLASEFKVLWRPRVLVGMSLAVIGAAAIFSLLTYIAPYLLTVTGVSSRMLPWMLVILGVGNAVGAFAGGRLADWRLVPSYVGLIVLLALIFAAMYVTGTEAIAMAVTMFLWGAIGFATLTPLQIIVINAAKEAPNLASTLLQSAFNTGIAAGSFVGGAALTLGFDYASLPWIGVVLLSMCAVIGIYGLAARNTAAAPESLL